MRVRLLASMTLACLLTACGASPRPGLTYWRALPGAAGAAQDELAARFNATHPGAPVTSEFQGSYSDLRTKLLTAAAAGLGPDVTQLGTFEIREFAKAGQLVDLREFMLDSPLFQPGNWPNDLLIAGEVDGGVYWLPFNVSVPVLYYNSEALAEAGLENPPETWDAFFNAARKLTTRRADGSIERYGLALWNITWPMLSAIWSEGGELTDREYTNITLNHPVAIEILGNFQALITERAAIMPDQASGGHRALFKNGRAAMILDSPAPYREIMSQAKGFTPKTALYPAGKAGRVYAPGGGGLSIFAACPAEKRRAAWDFIAFMLRADSLAEYARTSGYVAFTKDAQAAADFLDDPNQRPIYEALPYIRADFSLNMAPALRNAFDQAYQRIMAEGANPKAALDAADAEAEAGAPRE